MIREGGSIICSALVERKLYDELAKDCPDHTVTGMCPRCEIRITDIYVRAALSRWRCPN